MSTRSPLPLALTLITLAFACSELPSPPPSLAEQPSLQLLDAGARYVPALDAIVFEMALAGDAGSVTPQPAGQLDGAPVLGYVFPTTLAPQDVGFAEIDGTVALAVTSHPDFDDTPLWDEDENERFDDDGAVYHAHWVVLRPDSRAPAGLAVAQADDPSLLPPTAPMAMYLDSPGFTVIEDGPVLRVIVPLDRVRRRSDFEIGALTALMRVDASAAPLLAVHEVLSQLHGGAPLSPIEDAALAPAAAWPESNAPHGALDVTQAGARYDAALDTFVFSMEVAGLAGAHRVTPAGSVDGAPVTGYVFPTNIPPAVVGFADIDGLLVLAVTSHPDFDDTPLWDEDLDRDYGNDGAVYHVHWAVLVEDAQSPAGLSVPSQTEPSKLPPTAPMPMYLDSPGFHAFASGGALHVLVPAWHLGAQQSFSFDAVTAHMRVDASGPAPVLRVEQIVDVLSGDLSMPLTPTGASLL